MSRLIGTGSTALVTGCSSGLGLALVRFLLSQKLTVWGISRRRPEGGFPAGFHWHGCDLADGKGRQKVLKSVLRESGGIDLLVNNAGFGKVATLPELSDEEIEACLQVLLLAPILTTRFFLTAGEKGKVQRPAVVVNTSSLATELPIPLMTSYNAAKAGLSGFTQAMVLDRNAYPETRFIDFRPGDYRTPFATNFSSQNGAEVRMDYMTRLVKNHARALAPERAATDLWRAIRAGREGTVRSGSFFQAIVAPLGVRLLPSAFLRRAIRRYYGLKS